MNVIFLDLDGVLNSERSFLASAMIAKDEVESVWHRTWRTIDPIAVNLVNRLCKDSKSKIVISSSHKKEVPSGPDKLFGLRDYFETLGIDHDLIVGWTPTSLGIRGNEIQAFLDKHPEITNYLIIDDTVEFLSSQLGNFTRCDSEIGMSAKNYREGMQILTGDAPLFITF